MPEAITVRTLTDGGQSASDVAGTIAAFLGGAERSLDLAQYDFHLSPDTARIVGDAIRDAAGRGVAIRFVYNVDHRFPIPVPPPPEPDVALISSLPAESRAIAGVPDLMHHKYVVRDGASVWIDSPELAARFTANFEELWTKGIVEQSGFQQPDPVDVDGRAVRAWFCPGHGDALSHRYARLIGCARRRVRICSPVLTAAPVLATLAQLASDGTRDIAGCVDLTQVQGVVYQWRHNGNVSWKLPLLYRALSHGFSGKRSTPWEASGSLHDFMHAKVTVVDDTVLFGSFNLSHSGEQNAENVIEIEDAALADRLAAFVDGVRARYPAISDTDLNRPGTPSESPRHTP
jgi:phosphatidylserine/phosphatidylglycerophosphate/cardiolipin synthase-like enzyme